MGTTAAEAGVIYDATVTGVDLINRSFTATIVKTGFVADRCVWGAGVVSSLLGFKTNFLPPHGTKIKLIYGNPVSVGLPSEDTDLVDTRAPSHTSVGGEPLEDLKTYKAAVTGKTTLRGASLAGDLLEGEFELSNLLGVALTMLTTMAKLSAGDKAKVEVMLLNHMVRIVSEQFRHHSSFGDLDIYDDGRVNTEEHGSSYSHEVDGVKDPKDKRYETTNNVVDFSNANEIAETGRWRYSRYLGFLGDFIHVLVTDPVDSVGRLAADAFRSGKANLKVGGDGTVLVQSVSEIVLERVTRIPVPIRTKRYEDPKGVLAADFEKLEQEYLKIWNYGQDLKDISQTVYQLREYARWLSNYHALARFHQLAKKGQEWKIPTEKETPEPEWTNKEKDVEEANSGMGKKYYDTYSTFRIMRDGSQVLWSGHGHAVVLTENGCSISSTRDLTLEAAGNVSIIAGQNFSVKARRSVEISAVAGGLILKSRAYWRALCEMGSLWLKSDAEDPESEDYQEPTKDDLDWPEEDPLPEVLPHAIFLDATSGRALLQSKKKLMLQTTGEPKDEDSDDADVVIQSEKASATLIGKDVKLVAHRGMVKLKAAKDFLVKAGKVLLKANTFGIGQKFAFKNNKLNCDEVVSSRLTASGSIKGPEIGGPSPGGEPHYNHIQKNSGTEPEFLESDELEDLDKLSEETSKPDKAFENDEAPTWDYPESEEQGHPEKVYETLSQQYIQTTDDLDELYDVWDWSDKDALKDGDRNGSNKPYGYDKHHTHRGGDPLGAPSEKPVDQLNKQTELKLERVSFKFFKKQK